MPWGQETLNYWKQLPHILKYFRIEEDPKAALPKSFMQGFIEVRPSVHLPASKYRTDGTSFRGATRLDTASWRRHVDVALWNEQIEQSSLPEKPFTHHSGAPPCLDGRH